MRKQIRLNDFSMNIIGHQSSGMWRHPRDRWSQFNTIGYWTDIARIAPAVADIRARAMAVGRTTGAPLIFTLMTVIPERTDQEDQAKFAEYKRYVSPSSAMTLMSGWTGIDFSTYSLDDRLHQIRNDAIHSAVDAFTVSDPNRSWTIREIAELAGIGGTARFSWVHLSGSPMNWKGGSRTPASTGSTLAYAMAPESFSDFTALIVSELQRLGIYKTEYPRGTLREKLFGSGAFLNATHPGGRCRRDARALAA